MNSQRENTNYQKSNDYFYTRYGERKTRAMKDDEGWILEGEFEEVSVAEEMPERRKTKDRRFKGSATLFETRSSERRRQRHLVDLFI